MLRPDGRLESDKEVSVDIRVSGRSRAFEIKLDAVGVAALHRRAARRDEALPDMGAVGAEQLGGVVGQDPDHLAARGEGALAQRRADAGGVAGAESTTVHADAGAAKRHVCVHG